MTAILLSDLHLLPRGDLLIGLDPWARFETVLQAALRRHPDAERLVFLGDLTHRAEPETYAMLAARLADIPLPVSLMLGNHDRRAPFAAAFPGFLDDEGFAQGVVDLGATRLILCDTLDEAAPDRHSGWMCPRRMAWLDRALEDTEGRRVVVLTHHPLIATGFDGMDAIRLRNGEDVAARLRRAGAEIVISGHVHRAIMGGSKGLAWAVLPSPCHQMPLQLGPGGSDLSADAPGGYGLLLESAGGVTLHFADTSEPEVLSEPGSA